MKNKTSRYLWLNKFIILNSLLFFLLGLLFLVNSNLKTDTVSLLYMLLVDVGHIAFLPFVVYPLLFLVFIVTRSEKISLFLGALFGGLGIIYLVIDLMVYLQYHFHINKFIFDMIFGVGATDIFQFPIDTYIYVSLFILGVCGVEFLLAKWSLSKRYLRLKFKIVFFFTLISMVSAHLIHAYSHANFYNSVIRAGRVYPLFMPLTANSFFAKYNLVDVEKLKERQQLKKQSVSDVFYPKKPLEFKKTEQYNVLFIMIDCWRGDTFTPDITPNMYKYASKSQVFLNHYSGSCGTRSSIFSVFYGLPAFAYWDTMYGIAKGPIYFKTLMEQNYDMGIFASATLSNPPLDRTVFVEIPNLRRKTKSENNSPWVKDEKAQEEFINFLDNHQKLGNKKHFFGYLFYDAVHGYSSPNEGKGPFQPALKAPNYLALNNDYDPVPFFNLYKNVLYETDKRIGKLLEELEKRDVLKNTIIVFSGDHGQEFNDNKNNYWGHNGNYSKAQTHIPLMIYYPNKEARVYSHQTMHYDIVPTLMTNNQGCVNSPNDYSIGYSLFDESPRPYYVSGSFDSYAIIEKDKIITINYEGTYNITDLHMNTLENQKLDSKRFREVFKSVNRFYHKD